MVFCDATWQSWLRLNFAVLPGAAFDGESEHEVPAACTEHTSVTLRLKPFCFSWAASRWGGRLLDGNRARE